MSRQQGNLATKPSPLRHWIAYTKRLALVAVCSVRSRLASSLLATRQPPLKTRLRTYLSIWPYEERVHFGPAIGGIIATGVAGAFIARSLVTPAEAASVDNWQRPEPGPAGAATSAGASGPDLGVWTPPSPSAWDLAFPDSAADPYAYQTTPGASLAWAPEAELAAGEANGTPDGLANDDMDGDPLARLSPFAPGRAPEMGPGRASDAAPARTPALDGGGSSGPPRDSPGLPATPAAPLTIDQGNASPPAGSAKAALASAPPTAISPFSPEGAGLTAPNLSNLPGITTPPTAPTPPGAPALPAAVTAALTSPFAPQLPAASASSASAYTTSPAPAATSASAATASAASSNQSSASSASSSDYAYTTTPVSSSASSPSTSSMHSSSGMMSGMSSSGTSSSMSGSMSGMSGSGMMGGMSSSSMMGGSMSSSMGSMAPMGPVPPNPPMCSDSPPLTAYSVSLPSGVEGDYENTTVATFRDDISLPASDYSVTIKSLGETGVDFTGTVHATTCIGGNEGYITGTFLYTEDPSESIKVEITDTVLSVSSTCTDTVSITDAPVSATGVPPIIAAANVSFAANVSTVNPPYSGDPDDYIGTINWGDGTTSTGVDATYVMAGNHTYAAPGIYPVVVTITDGTGGPSTQVTDTADVWGAIEDGNGQGNSDRAIWGNPPDPALSDGPSLGFSTQSGNVQAAEPLDYNQSATSDSLASSAGLAGNPALVYNENTADPQPIIESYYPAAYLGTAIPGSFRVTFTWDSLSPTTQTYSVINWQNTGVYVFDSQAPAGAGDTTAGLNTWSVSAQAYTLGGATLLSPLSGTGTSFIVAQGTNAPYGVGWSLAGVELIGEVTGGVYLIPGGQQGTEFFESVSGSTTYQSPPYDFGTLVYDGSGWTYTSKDQVTSSFDSHGHLTAVTDPDGQTVTYTYTGTSGVAGVSTVQTPDGGLTTFTYSGANQLQTIEEPGNRVVTVTLDGTPDDLTGLDTPDGGIQTFTYDTVHRLTSVQVAPLQATLIYSNDELSEVETPPTLQGQTVNYDIVPRNVQGMEITTNIAITLSQSVGLVTDALNNVTTYGLNNFGNFTSVDTPDGGVYTENRDFAGQVTSYVDPLNRTTTYVYSSAGDLLTETLPGPSSEYFVYDPTYHHVTQATDTRGDITTYQYSASGDLTATKDALGDVTTMVWSGGLLQSETDANTHTTGYAYNTDRQLTAMTDALTHVTSYAYDSFGDLVSMTNGATETTTMAYDAMRRLISETDADSGITTYQYNAIGETAAMFDPLGNETKYQYDGHGWQTTMIEAAQTGAPGGPVTMTYGFDQGGRQTSSTDGDGHITTSVYDSMGRLLTQTSAVGGVQSYAYDLDGEMTSSTELDGSVTEVTAYSYSNRGWQTATTDALGDVTTQLYDSEGNLTRTVDADGHATTFAYDRLNRQTASTQALTDAVTHVATTVYDAVGNVIRTTDVLGNVTSIAYDALNRMTSTTDALGDVSTTAYDAVGNVVQTTDALTHVTSVAYDLMNRMTSTTDAASGVSTTVYDLGGNVIRTTDVLHHVTSMAYDALNRMTSTTDALGHVSTTLYDGAGNVTETIDQNGNPTFGSYDGLNRLTATTDALTHVVGTIYDALGNVIRTTDALGDVTTNVYDALNRLIVTTDGMGDVSSTLYDGVGNVTETIDGNGKATYNAYDALNRLTATTDATTTDVVITVYDAGGNIIRSTDALGHVTSYAFDAINRMTSTTDALGHVSKTVYDADGDTIRTTDALGHVTSYAFDALNRLTKTTTPAGDVSATFYDAAGDVTETTDGVGSITYNQYDVLNRMIATTDALGGVTIYGFDYVGNQTSVTDPDGNTTTLVYDVVNRQTELIDPLGHSATMAYDGGNRLTSVTDRDGRIDDYAYDKDNRLIGATWIVGGTTVNLFTYTYDADSNELTAGNYAGTYTMGYDVLDRPTSVQEPFGPTLTFAYDKDGNRTQVTDSFGGLASYVYDNDNQLTTEEFGGTGQTPLRINFAYDAGGELTTITRFSNLAGTATVILTVETYTLDGMVKNIEQKSSSGTILENFTYTYDADDRVYTETDNGTLETYTYDADGALLGNGTESYSYDANGNRTNTGYTNSVNQITTDGTWNFSYDAEGNLTKAVGTAGVGTGQTWVYTYDNDSRLIGATETQTTGGMLLTQATYVYDALNNRIEKDVDTSGTTTIQRYGYDVSTVPSPSVGGAGTEGATDLNAVPLNIWVDINSSNALETRYLWASPGSATLSTQYSALSTSSVDRLFARIPSAGTAAWYLDDRLGSVRNITNNSGTLIDTITYDPFGNVLSESSPTNGDRYKFAGTQLDSETSLSYDLDRYYDTVHGRFTTQDPADADANPYRYVDNNPVNATDPTGLIALYQAWGGGVGDDNQAFAAQAAPDANQNKQPVNPVGQLKLTARSVGGGPQSGRAMNRFYYVYWGVGLYLNDAGWDVLKQAGGGYIISKRTLSWSFEDLPPGEKLTGKASDTRKAWFLDPISFDTDGNVVVNRNYANGNGGSRAMDGATAAAYLTVVNLYRGTAARKGKITVSMSYQLFSGPPSAKVIASFDKSGRPPGLTDDIGFDQYVHAPWTENDPGTHGKVLAGGEIDGTFSLTDDTFSSTSTGIGGGPQRLGKKPQLGHWIYDPKTKSWTRIPLEAP